MRAAGLVVDEEEHERSDLRITVERMKADAAAGRIVNRIGQQRVKVHEHGRNMVSDVLFQNGAGKMAARPRREWQCEGSGAAAKARSQGNRQGR